MAEPPNDQAHGPGGDADRRRHPRHPVSGVSGSLLFTTEGRIVNLSLDGIALETGETLQIGRLYKLKLRHASEELLLKGRVVWCRMVRTDQNDHGEVAPVYAAGIQFEELLSEEAREVYRFLGENAVVSLDKRLFGRFHLEGGHNAQLDLEATFEVRTISLSGMEVQSEAYVEQEALVQCDIETEAGVLELRGRVAYCRWEPESQPRPETRLGIEFLDLAEEAARGLGDLIKSALR